MYICSMESLNLPEYKPRLERREGKLAIFDPVRKKLVILTPEEWVRQHFLNYMIQDLKYPKSRIKIESGLAYNSLQKRSDLVFYDNELKPQVLVECKAASVKIDQHTFDQLAIYNKTLGAKYIIATNGMVHYACCRLAESEKFDYLGSIPAYSEL